VLTAGVLTAALRTACGAADDAEDGNAEGCGTDGGDGTAVKTDGEDGAASKPARITGGGGDGRRWGRRGWRRRG